MRLGDLDELKERISSYAGRFTDEGFMVDLTAVLRGIEFQKAIDAVPVVRCKDCMHMVRKLGACHCYAWGHFNGAGEDGFCNYGEKKEADGNAD